MLKHLTAAFAASALLIAPAHAALIDFAAEADTNGERGLMSGDFITIDGVSMQLLAANGNDEASPYLDAGLAGLGVCKVLDGSDQCDPGNDDNVTSDEQVVALFLNDGFTDFILRDIQGLVFRDAGHNLINATNDGLVTISTSNGTMTDLFSTFVALAAGGDAFFKNTIGIAFEFVDKQFYVSAVDVSDVPIPAALPLLMSGLAGLGFASRKRKQV